MSRKVGPCQSYLLCVGLQTTVRYATVLGKADKQLILRNYLPTEHISQQSRLNNLKAILIRSYKYESYSKPCLLKLCLECLRLVFSY